MAKSPTPLPLEEPPEPTAYDAAFEAAIDELDELMTEREVLDERRDIIDKRISRLRQGVFGIATLCGISRDDVKERHSELFPDSIDPDTGLTDAVREVLYAHEETFVSPVFIRDFLKTSGYEITKYKNALASIHSVLKRLKTQGEVLDSNREGRTVYKWAKNGPPTQQPPDLSDEDIPF